MFKKSGSEVANWEGKADRNFSPIWGGGNFVSQKFSVIFPEI